MTPPCLDRRPGPPWRTIADDVPDMLVLMPCSFGLGPAVAELSRPGQRHPWMRLTGRRTRQGSSWGRTFTGSSPTALLEHLAARQSVAPDPRWDEPASARAVR